MQQSHPATTPKLPCPICGVEFKGVVKTPKVGTQEYVFAPHTYRGSLCAGSGMPYVAVRRNHAQ